MGVVSPPSILSGVTKPGPARSRLLVQQSGLVTVAGRQRAIPCPSVDDTTNNTLNSRVVHYAPSTSDISDIVLAFPGFGINASFVEADFPVSYTATAAIEYPAGTFYPVYLNGSRNIAVTPGRTLVRTDPLPITIPAGAQFFVKCFASWSAGHFWMTENGGYLLAAPQQGWCNAGTGLADNTLTATTFTQSESGNGFTPFVYGRLASPIASVGILGDSISVATGEQADSVTGAIFMERAFRGIIPVNNVSKVGLGLLNLVPGQRNEGMHLILRDSISHLIISLGRNDLQGNTAATTEANLQKIMAPFLSRGVKIFGVTVVPTTTSTDNFATTANQTVANAANETQRLLYNTWLRANWQSIGMSGLLDWAHVADPTDSGKWNVSNRAGRQTQGFSTLTNRGISAVSLAQFTSGAQGGNQWPNSSTIPCTVRPYPGDTGTGGGVVNATSNGSGVITGFTVVTPGDYDFPPMVAPQGAWTNDGTHGSPLFYNEVIYQTGLQPSWFTI